MENLPVVPLFNVDAPKAEINDLELEIIDRVTPDQAAIRFDVASNLARRKHNNSGTVARWRYRFVDSAEQGLEVFNTYAHSVLISNPDDREVYFCHFVCYRTGKHLQQTSWMLSSADIH